MLSVHKGLKLYYWVSIALLISMLITNCRPRVENQTPVVSPSPAPATTSLMEPTEQPDQGLPDITIWIPPRFAPDTTVGSLLYEHLTTFENAYGLINLNIRVKEETGPSGILETLSTASLVAPSTLPDIVLFDPDALKTAALKNLISPLEAFTPSPATPEWYSFAIEAAFVDNTFFGLPFLSKAESFAYRKDAFETEPTDWADLLSSAESFLIPMGDPESKFSLIQYSAMGGKVLDDQGRPTIDTELLTDLLYFYLSANSTGLLPLYSLQIQYADETSIALMQGNTNAAVIPVETIQKESITTTFLVTPWPTRDGSGIIPTRTFSWGVVAKDYDHPDHISQILQWLCEPTFLGRISQSSGLIPATSDALLEWTDPNSSAILSRLIRVAVPEPSIEEITTFGPLLRSAIEDVLNGRSTPEEAAENISNQVEIP